MMGNFRAMVIGLVVGFLIQGDRATVGEDWPQWMGPRRDSHWNETGLIEKFAPQGPKIKWRAPIALGYAGPAVSQGRVFVMDYEHQSGEIANNPGGRSELEGKERVICLDGATGKPLWKHEYTRKYALSYASGPRCTPTVEGDRVYALGAEGNFWCLSAKDGKVLWSKDFGKEYKQETPLWGYCAHPLVDDKNVYCVVGGEGCVAVAFDKLSGKEIWRALSAPEPGYCPPTFIDHGGKRQLLIWHPESLNSLDPRTGTPFWSVPVQPAYRMSITAPRKSGDFLYVSGIGSVALLLKLNGTQPGAEIEWKSDGQNAVYCANATPLIDEGVIYGADCQVGCLMAVRLEDGKRLWQTFAPTSGSERRVSHGTAHLVKNGDRYFIFSETGDLIIARLTPKGYDEISRAHVVDPTAECFGRNVVWAHPAFAQRCAFVRNDKEIVCVDLAR